MTGSELGAGGFRGTTSEPVDLTLSTFEVGLQQESVAGSPMQSAFGCFLALLLVADVLLLQLHSSAIEQPAIDLLDRNGYPVAATVLVVLLHAFVAWHAVQALRRSSLHRQIDSRPTSILTFGFGFSPANRSLLLRNVAVWGLLAALLGCCIWMVPPLPGNAPLAASVLGNFLLLALPVLGGWVCTVLMFRAVQDRYVRGGCALAITVLVIVLSFGVGEGSAAIAQYRAEGLSFRLIDLVLAWGVLTALVYAVVANPFDVALYRLNGDEIALAPLVASYSPFGRTYVAQKQLTFSLGTAQVLAFTRGWQADHYQSIKSSDEQLSVPLHDRSIQIWNVDRLLDSLPKKIEITDSQQQLTLCFELGKMAAVALGSGATTKIERASVDLAAQLLIRNTDLAGLVYRSARDAFEMHVVGFRATVVAVRKVLAEPPVSFSAALTEPGELASDELELWQCRYRDLAGRATERLKHYKEVVTELDQALSTIQCWKQMQGVEGSPGYSVEHAWMDRMLAELGGASHAGANSQLVAETRSLLRTMGLCFNEASITETDDLHRLRDQVKTARAALETEHTDYKDHARQAEARAAQEKRDEKARRDKLVESLLGALANNPNLSPSNLVQIIASISHLLVLSPGDDAERLGARANSTLSASPQPSTTQYVVPGDGDELHTV